MQNFKNLILIQFILMSCIGMANSLKAPPLHIDHCYHWLDEASKKFLTFKYDEAKKNNGAFSFYTTHGNGAVAGDGIYCSKTLIGSIGYGDRVVRLDFVPDVVMRDDVGRTGNSCGTNGKMLVGAACQQKTPDVVYYSNGNEWYVIKNPQSIKSWSANSDQLIQDILALQKETSTQSSKLKATITKIKAEANKLGQHTYMNGKARFDLLDILKDPAKEAQQDPISLMQMISSYPDDKISKSDKKQYYTKYLSRLLQNDNQLSIDDLEVLVKQDAEIQTILKSQLAQFDIKKISHYDSKFIFEASQKKWITLSPEKEKIVWKNYVQSSADVNLYKKLMASNSQSQNFFTILPDPDSLVQAKDPIEWLNFLDKIPSSKGSNTNLRPQTAALFLNLILKGDIAKLKSVYSGLSSQQLDKEDALLDAIDPNKQNALRLDTMSIATAIAGLDPNSRNPRFVQLRNGIIKTPLTLNEKPTSKLLEELENGQFVLPDFMSQDVYLTKLVERSINAQYVVKNPESVFTFIFNHLGPYFAKKINSTNSIVMKAKLLRDAEQFFNGLSSWLLRGHYSAYAYTALYYASFYEGGMQAKTHTLEGYLNVYQQGNQKLDALLEESVVKSFDAPLFQFLLTAATNGNQKASTLIQKTIQYMASSEFLKEIARSQFKLSYEGKIKWSNKPENKNNGIDPDVCHFIGYMKAQVPVLQTRFQGSWDTLLQNSTEVKENLCD